MWIVTGESTAKLCVCMQHTRKASIASGCKAHDVDVVDADRTGVDVDEKKPQLARSKSAALAYSVLLLCPIHAQDAAASIDQSINHSIERKKAPLLGVYRLQGLSLVACPPIKPRDIAARCALAGQLR